ncbi:hypothetical protein MTO96_040713 [Rhipicephalus appendiculatus]
MASVKKRKNLDFATKLKAVQRVEVGEKSSTVADGIGIPGSTRSTLLKNKADIKAKAAEQRTSGACRVRAPAHGKVEKALYASFLEVRAKNIPVDGPMLMDKAKWFAAALECLAYWGRSKKEDVTVAAHGLQRILSEKIQDVKKEDEAGKSLMSRR